MYYKHFGLESTYNGCMRHETYISLILEKLVEHSQLQLW